MLRRRFIPSFVPLSLRARRSAALVAALALLGGGVVTPAAAAPAAASPAALSQGLDLSNVDPTCPACKDFYQFADGGYAASHPIPADRFRVGGFDTLSDRQLEILHGVLDDAAAHASADPSSDLGKLGSYYAACTDTVARDAAGLTPLAPELAKIDAIADVPSLVLEIASLRRIGVATAFGFSADADAKHSEQTIAELSPGRLGLPEREYYLRDDGKSVKQRADYATFAGSVLALSNAPAGAAPGDIVALETAIAKVTPTRAQRRDPLAAYNPETLAQLAALAPGVDWAAFFGATGAPAFASLNVTRPAYVTAVARLLSATPLATWRTYLRFRTIATFAPQLSSNVSDLSFAFYGMELQGQQRQRPLWQRCAQSAQGDLQDIVSIAFAKKAFTPEAKARAVALVANVHAALHDDLETLSWMTPKTRVRAEAKLAAIVKKIGYPDHPRDYSALTFPSGAFASLILAKSRFNTDDELSRIGHETDRTRWGMSAPTVNAYYNPSNNEIVFPAGILGEPFFDADADDAVNYGGIGVVMGHETTHGFDDQGRQYDEAGNLDDWWQPEDAVAFKARAKCIVDQFSSYTIAGTNLNGEAVQGEAIADLGGATLAFRAFEKTAEAKAGKKIGGYTPEQRFFISFAQVWASSEREDAERQQALTDPHPAAMWRVIGTLSNMPEFQAAFHCKALDAMVREARCQIW